jgi:hypothetical protein
MTTIQVVPYQPEHKQLWDQFISQSKNGTFLFYRDYMDYHADRFPDSSLMFLDEDETLIAVMPATRKGQTLSSHAGLTFGGVVSNARMKTALMLEVFESMKAHLLTIGVSSVLYKTIPHVYHRLPAEEDLYALYRNNARLVRRDVSSAIDMNDRLPFSKGRRYEIKQALKYGVQVRQTKDYETFMAIEANVLESKYNSRPVHSASELKLLANRFPEHIKLFAAYREKEMLAGVVIYESTNVVHAQYIGATDEGKKTGASDLVLNHLINDYCKRRYFDFGVSTEDDGRYLNAGLIENKQSFGARAIVHDFYQLDIQAE